MDFNRGGQVRPSSAANTANRQTAGASGSDDSHPHESGLRKKFNDSGKFIRWSYVSLLLSGTVLFIAMIFSLVFGTPVGREARYVDNGKYQAVFVNVNGTNGGQVYFGRITSLTEKYIRLTNVFYIQNQSDTTKANSAYNLVKLGCELHGPADEMLINRDQVFFWENLKDDSQVTKKATEFYKQNPNGQKCDSTSNNTQTPSETNTGTPSTTTPSTTNNKTDTTKP